MKTICPLIAVLALTGCETVEMQYTVPAPQGNFDAVEAQANEHYEYFVFPKSYVLVTPVQSVVGKGAAPQANKDNGANNADKNQGKTATNKTKTRTGTDAGKDQAPSANNSSPPSAPPSLSNGSATAIIDGQEWEARVVLLPDDSRAMAVKGVSGFWKSTSVGITKYQNTDMVAAVSTTAENLVPKRIGQIASVVSTGIQIAALFAVSEGPKTKKLALKSFVAEVPAKTTDINDDWNYKLTYDSSVPPKGTVSFNDFQKLAMNRSVPYWPVPACRSATLELHRASDNSDYAFHVVVSSSEVLRLQPLSIKGKLELGSVCGATLSGETLADNFSTFSDNLEAVKQAVETIKNAKNPPNAGAGQ